MQKEHKPDPLFDGGPGGGSFGLIEFLSTGLSVGIISTVGNTNFAPGKFMFRLSESPLGDRLCPTNVVKIGCGSVCSYLYLCLSYLACCDAFINGTNRSYALLSM